MKTAQLTNASSSDFILWPWQDPPSVKTSTLLARAKATNRKDPTDASRTVLIEVYRTGKGGHLAVANYTTRYDYKSRSKWGVLYGIAGDDLSGPGLPLDDLLCRLDGDHALEVSCLGFHRWRWSTSEAEREVFRGEVAEVNQMWREATAAIFADLGYIRQRN